MPEQDSKRVHRQHARLMAAHLGVKLVVKRISPVLRAAGTYRLLPLRFLPAGKLRGWLVSFAKSILLDDEEKTLLMRRLQVDSNSWIAKGNAYAIAKHRVRMVVLYQYAEVRSLMVVGAANRTEWLTGTFSKWGVDHCADMMPILGLYRTQVEALAAYLQVPEEIRSKPADPDIMPGLSNKDVLLGDFMIVDQVLHGIEHGARAEQLRAAFDPEIVDWMFNLWKHSRHMRESPYT
jgi:NAD+ synthase